MNRNRNIQFNIRLTEKELSAYEKKRAVSGLGKTDFFVRLIGSSTIKVYRRLEMSMSATNHASRSGR